jgi:lipopolysaccharide transport system permease protein
MLGWQDVKQAYRRSALGPFWITVSMLIQIGTMGFVFGTIFKSSLPEYLPYLSISVVIWSLIAGALTESCLTFINSESLIKQLKLPTFVYLGRTLWKQILIFGHNLLIVPLAFLVVLKGVNTNILLAIPGMLLLVCNLAWMGYFLGALSARFRDVPQIVASVVTILFFISPVMWQPNLIPDGTAHLLLGLNPLYHLLQVARLPILGTAPTFENWVLSLTFAIIGWSAVRLFFARLQNKIAYWV